MRRAAVALGAIAAAAVLLLVAGPEFLRQGASALLVLSRSAEAASPYAITVQPGDTKVPKGSDQSIHAKLAGFKSNDVGVWMKPDGEAAFVVPVARREQGLIVAAGNPMRIRDVSDLARPGLRFVNRQRGAASRTWLDRLLREGGIPPERIAGYDPERLIHGEAVAIGMALAFRFSVRQGLCPPSDAERVVAHLESIGLPVRPAQIPGGWGSVDDVLAAMTQDKKVKDGALTFILARGIGQSFIAPRVPADAVRAFLSEVA